MEITKLSSKGQIILPKAVRDARNWEAGTEFSVEDAGDGVLLRPLKPFPATRHQDVFGCLKYQGRALSVEEMDRAVEKEAKRHK
jgi:AbrB family looped-hinge helix DNA binding protein